MRLKYKSTFLFQLQIIRNQTKNTVFKLKYDYNQRQSIDCDNYNVTIANQSIFIKCLKLPSFEHFRDFQEIEAYSLKDVGRVVFGGNNAPYIRKSMKVAIFLPRRAKPGRSRAKKRRSKYTHSKDGAQRNLRNIWSYRSIQIRRYHESALMQNVYVFILYIFSLMCKCML